MQVRDTIAQVADSVVVTAPENSIAGWIVLMLVLVIMIVVAVRMHRRHRGVSVPGRTSVNDYPTGRDRQT